MAYSQARAADNDCSHLPDIREARNNLPRRQHFDDVKGLSKVVHFWIMFPVLSAGVVALFIRIVIEAALGSSDRSALRIAAIVVWALDLLLLNLLTPLPQVLFIFEFLAYEGGLPQSSQVYVVLSLIGNWWTLHLVAITVMWVMRKYTYRRWLQSFNQDWKSSRGSRNAPDGENIWPQRSFRDTVSRPLSAVLRDGWGKRRLVLEEIQGLANLTVPFLQTHSTPNRHLLSQHFLSR